jgi:hypothetical protein
MWKKMSAVKYLGCVYVALFYFNFFNTCSGVYGLRKYDKNDLETLRYVKKI